MKKITSILTVLGILVLAVTVSGCTSSSSEASYSSFKTYDNYGYSFEYPDSWVIDYENEANVYFNSSNGQIRIIFPLETYGMPIGAGDDARTTIIGDKTVERAYDAKNDAWIYSTLYPDDAKEMSITGPNKDRIGLEKVIETFKFITTSSTSTPTNSTSSQDTVISSSQAMAIANSYIEEPGAAAGTPWLIDDAGQKIYIVPVILNGSTVGQIEIDAITGRNVGGAAGAP